MSDKQLYCFFGEAANFTDPDAFASEVSLSLLDPDNPSQDVDANLFKQLHVLWHVKNDPFRSFLDCMGLSQSECSRRFCVPLRTVQGWTLGERSCPPYIRLMMAEITGILRF